MNILEVENLNKGFPIRSGLVRAVNNVSFQLRKGGILGLVGESGSGKSTTALCILRLYEPDSGRIVFDGQDITHLSERALRPLRRRVQMVFQDPTESLNPRMTVGQAITEPLLIHRGATAGGKVAPRELVLEIMDQVGLKSEHYSRFPHQMSTGQRQRVGLARAMILNPDLVILDEPTSALDVSVRGQVLELLLKLQDRFALSYMMISHDLNVIARVCDRVGVMYLGSILELGTSSEIFFQPLHPYTKALVSAIPSLTSGVHHERVSLKGEIPSPVNIPPGCVFSTRCLVAEPRCRHEVPRLQTVNERQVACHLVSDG